MTWNRNDTSRALNQVAAERGRQEGLKEEGKFEYGPADPELSDADFLAVLAEEVGEANHEYNETIGRPAKRDINYLSRFREELVQVAAVAVGRVELLNRLIAMEVQESARWRPEPTAADYSVTPGNIIVGTTD